jgi:hypothetical protein
MSGRTLSGRAHVQTYTHTQAPPNLSTTRPPTYSPPRHTHNLAISCIPVDISQSRLYTVLILIVHNSIPAPTAIIPRSERDACFSTSATWESRPCHTGTHPAVRPRRPARAQVARVGSRLAPAPVSNPHPATQTTPSSTTTTPPRLPITTTCSTASLYAWSFDSLTGRSRSVSHSLGIPIPPPSTLHPTLQLHCCTRSFAFSCVLVASERFSRRLFDFQLCRLPLPTSRPLAGHSLLDTSRL